jgi:hypothetical protein
MNSLQNCKFVNVTPPAAIVNNAAFTTATVDTKGWRKVTFLVILGALDIALSALKLQQSDDSGMAGAADISGADFSVSPLTLPSATDDNKLFMIYVDTRGKKGIRTCRSRWATARPAASSCVIAILHDGETVPSTATLRGLSQQAVV